MCATAQPTSTPSPTNQMQRRNVFCFFYLLVDLASKTLALHSRSGLKVFMFLKSWTNTTSSIHGLRGLRTPALAYTPYAMLMLNCSLIVLKSRIPLQRFSLACFHPVLVFPCTVRGSTVRGCAKNIYITQVTSVNKFD